MHGILVTILAGFSAVAVAQSLTDLPTCAQGCVGSGVSASGCSSLDFQCICSNTSYLSGLACCLSTACSAEDQQRAVDFASSLCSGVGVTVPSQVVCASASASASSSAAASSTAATTTATTSPTTGVAGGAAPTGTGGAAPTGGNSTSVSGGSTPTAPAGTNGAASIQLGAGLSLAGMAAVVMALL